MKHRFFGMMIVAVAALGACDPGRCSGTSGTGGATTGSSSTSTTTAAGTGGGLHACADAGTCPADPPCPPGAQVACLLGIPACDDEYCNGAAAYKCPSPGCAAPVGAAAFLAIVAKEGTVGWCCGAQTCEGGSDGGGGGAPNTRRPFRVRR